MDHDILLRPDLPASGGARRWPMAGVYCAEMIPYELIDRLQVSGIPVQIFYDPDAMLAGLEGSDIGIAIVCWNAPGAAALKLCEAIRQAPAGRHLPLGLVLSESCRSWMSFAECAGADVTILEGVDAAGGADRLVRMAHEARNSGEWRIYGWLAVNDVERKATSNGLPVALSPAAFEIFKAFMQRPEQGWTRDTLVQCLRCSTVGEIRPKSITKEVTSLRRSFQRCGQVLPLLTSLSLGYVLDLSFRDRIESLARFGADWFSLFVA